MTLRLSYAPFCSLAILLTLLITLFLTSACLVPAADAPIVATSTIPRPSITVQTEQEGDSFEIRGYEGLDANTLTIDIFSERGMGSATITLSHDSRAALPDNIIIRLYLQGLEHLQISTDSQIVIASVPSTSEAQPLQSASATSNDPAQAQVISADNPLWLEIMRQESTTESGRASHFAVTLPARLFQDPQSIDIEWIDFYR